MTDKDLPDQYVVVLNHEEQYSIWPVGRAIPAGWREGGKTGEKQECLNFISEVWTDMRPLSLRREPGFDHTAPATASTACDPTQ
jgi:MbtH protein